MAEATFSALLAESRQRRRRAPFHVGVLRRVDSTNRLAGDIRRELAEDNLSIATVALLAYEQTGGRGRYGRVWSSPPGQGIYATLFGRLGDPERLPILPLAVGVAVAEVLDRHLPVACRLKWPNDLMVKGRKLGGILVESAMRGGRREVVVGFGVNHSQGERELATPAATSMLLETADPPALPVLAWDLMEAVAAEMRSTQPRQVTIQRWLLRSVHAPGDVVRARLAERELSGRFLGLTPDGRLRLATEGGEEALAAAEVVEG